MTDFITPDDVQSRRVEPFSAEQLDVVATLCSDVSDMIRSDFPDVDTRLALPEGDIRRLTEQTVKRIASNMVRRAIGDEDPGVTQKTEAAGPFNMTVQFANVDGNLYYTSSERSTLDGPLRSRRAFAVDLGEPNLIEHGHSGTYYEY